jgi:penicillin amidase
MLIKVAAVLVLMVLAAGAGGYWYLRRSLPVVNGTVTVPGLSAPVEIVRDADSIPHVFAATRADAFFGLGYVHAQDRLWQMEFQRRIGHGRLSEIFGAATVPQDRFLRTVGFGRAARSAWERLPRDARALIDAYCAGVNAFIASHSGAQLPPEFTLLRFHPEPWTGADVMAWVKMMAWDLSANYSFELMRHDMELKLGSARTAELLPAYPVDGLSIINGHGPNETEAKTPPSPATAPDAIARSFVSGLSQGHPAVRRLLLNGARTEALGSNNWVVDGTLSRTGKPLLANDPHLGTHVPSLWYLAHMSAGEFDVIGATLPGAPAVAIGRNRYIAWGETNVAADVEDLFLERLDATGTLAEYKGTMEPLRVFTETIQVSGGEPVHVTVRVSRHGPLVSDAINANNAEAERDADDPTPAVLPPMAFRWTALDEEDRTVLAFLRLNEARNWQEFTTALRDFVVPAQNFVYADVEGHIGYYAPGRVPIRSAGDGSRPAQGWTGEMEWNGWIPFEELPHAYDPPEHFIVTANHRPAGPGYPHLIALEFPEPYRAERIAQMLREKPAFGVDDFRTIQADTLSLHARDLLPLLLRQVDPDSESERRAVDLLNAWDHKSSGDSAAAAIFQGWFLELAPALAGDELGALMLDSYEGRFTYITRFVRNTLTGDDRWCDNVETASQTEDCRHTITLALRRALEKLSASMGGDPGRWQWGRVHTAVFPHQGLDAVPALRPFLSRSVPSGGDWSTVNVGAVDVDFAYEQRAIPGYRQIVDLSPANDSRFLDAVGQSGHFLSRHYDDFLEDWRAVRHRKMRMDRREIDRDQRGTLRLTP